MINPDGSVGQDSYSAVVANEIDADSIPKEDRGIDISVLAVIAVPPASADKWKEHPPRSDEERRDSERSDEILMDFIRRWEGNLKHADSHASVVEIPGAHHYMFVNE